MYTHVAVLLGIFVLYVNATAEEAPRRKDTIKFLYISFRIVPAPIEYNRNGQWNCLSVKQLTRFPDYNFTYYSIRQLFSFENVNFYMFKKKPT